MVPIFQNIVLEKAKLILVLPWSVERKWSHWQDEYLFGERADESVRVARNVYEIRLLSVLCQK